MVPGRSLGVPWGVPGSFCGTPGASRGPFGTLLGKAAKINKKMKRARSPKAAILGSGRDPKINKKRTHDQKAGLGKLLRNRFSLILGVIAVLNRFLGQKVSFFDDFPYFFGLKKQRGLRIARVVFV